MSWRLVQGCTLPSPKCRCDRLTIAHNPERENSQERKKEREKNKKILNPAPDSVLAFSLNVGPMALFFLKIPDSVSDTGEFWITFGQCHYIMPLYGPFKYIEI